MATANERPDLPAPLLRVAGAPTPLEGLRVVDFSHFIAGPMCTLFLGDMGAEVIKIENAAKGDDFRRFQPYLGGESVPFLWVNRNKSGIALDLATDAARDVAKDLIASADVLVENFSKGVMDRFGLGFDQVKEINPRLIYCSVSAYGRDGALADRLGFDPVIQAETGFMSLNGYPDQPGVRTGPAVMDISTGMIAAIAVLGGIAARERTGRGQQVEVSLHDTATLMLGFHAMNYLATGQNPTRFGNRSMDSAPTGVFNAADGPLYIACANDRTYRRLVTDVLERRDLVEHSQFATNAERVANRGELTEVIEGILAGNSCEYWADKMQRAGVPAGPVRTVAGAFQSSDMAERALATSIPHPTAGQIPNIGSPMKFKDTPLADPVAAPTLGQHTHEVLTQMLGYSSSKIEELTARGAFGEV
ncbi:CaiB/BaiF CoA transferase family protein [Rhodopseudomonas sp. P2A-2r]|uniref:CaiB/BaiF CoA transferase family protein n=1 Tax=unclassified Rhodopseudomonas TaxID=2638247 RepID=UPI002234DA38|nr:CoA transferase [Rhodopseudomonas sp. P2A-2r]UZE47865.1 CoA transferase [Rhodopseudomonas sp. P2A-2r]